MPVYLIHGFRWPREGFTGIRVHAIVHNLEDCSVEYIQNDNSRNEIIGSFQRLFPEQMGELNADGRVLHLIEQHDPSDLYSAHAVSQPYAFVADTVLTFADVQEATTLSIDVEEAMNAHTATRTKAGQALADIRDKIAEGQRISWWMVYNGDPDRSYDSETDEDEEDNGDENNATTPVQVRSPDHEPAIDPSGPALILNVIPQETAIREKSGAAPPEERKEIVSESLKLKEVAPKLGFRRKFFSRKA